MVGLSSDRRCACVEHPGFRACCHRRTAISIGGGEKTAVLSDRRASICSQHAGALGAVWSQARCLLRFTSSRRQQPFAWTIAIYRRVSRSKCNQILSTVERSACHKPVRVSGGNARRARQPAVLTPSNMKVHTRSVDTACAGCGPPQSSCTPALMLRDIALGSCCCGAAGQNGERGSVAEDARELASGAPSASDASTG